MSHTSKITGVVMNNTDALATACAAMGMVPPTRETVRLFQRSQSHEGVAIRLPGWQYPVVLKDDGEIVYDNYNGAWGKMETFERFCQQYTLAVASQSMADYAYTTTELPNGDLQVVFTQ